MLLGIFQSQCDHLEEKKKSFAPVWNWTQIPWLSSLQPIAIPTSSQANLIFACISPASVPNLHDTQISLHELCKKRHCTKQ
jgi:hypothetical protein